MLLRLCLTWLLFTVYFLPVHTGLLYRLLNQKDYQVDKLLLSLQGQHLVMIGDSLMRYQYLSLVHLIRFGGFPDEHGNDDIMLGRKFPTWSAFYNHTTALLAPHEVCDCFRTDLTNITSLKHANMNRIENRYYYDAKTNIRISYFKYFGDKWPLHGKWESTRQAGVLKDHVFSSSNSDDMWVFKDVTVFLSRFARRLQPAPTLLLLNAGHHKHNFHFPLFRREVTRAAHTVAPRVMWKTTSGRTDDLQEGVRNVSARTASSSSNLVDAAMCAAAGWRCLNLSWTSALPPSSYVDLLHLQPYAYADINIQFLLQLRTAHTLNYTALGREFVGGFVVNAEAPQQSFFVDARGRLRPHALSNVTTSPSTACQDKEVRHRAVRRLPAQVLLESIAGPAIPDLCAHLRSEPAPS